MLGPAMGRLINSAMRMSYSKIFVALVVAMSALEPSVFAKTLHDQAVASARAGRFDSAITLLQRLVRQQPKRMVYRYDLITVLSWAERHVEALDASRVITLNAQVPDYVLAAIGKSALSAHDHGRSVQAYRLLSQRRPQDADAARGLSLALLVGQQEHTTPVEPPSNVSAIVPISTDAPTEGLAAAQILNAQHIREAEVMLNTNFTAERYRLSDAALVENLELIAQAKAINATDILLRLRRDRVVALRDRGLNQQATDAFRMLDAQESATPAYVVAAAAEASLNQRLPERSIELYKRALQSEPANAAWRSGLMYAELEAENFPDAEYIVDISLTQSENTFAARRTQALLLRFADRLKDAQSVTQALAGEQPQDVGVWLDQGDLFLNRGLPRAAAERYQAVLVAEPTSIKARVGLADALWAQGAVAEAANLITTLKAEAPEHPAVQRLLRAWLRNARPLLTSSVTKGFGQGQVAGNDDLVWESVLYSGQSEAGVRSFVNHHLASASFDGRSASHERLGAGVEWTQRDLQTTVELGQDLRNGQDVVWAAGAAWQLNDQFSLRARYESQTNDFPLKGRSREAEVYLGAPSYLHADKSVVGVAYSWNESRRVAADFATYNFNDGNHRQSLSASWFERLYSGYGRTLDLQTSGYASTNTLRDAIYFNPKSDVAWSATLAGDWLTWRRYERSFNQRLVLTLGTYRQNSEVSQGGIWNNQSYGWNPFEEIRYEHEWHWGPDLSTRYGIGVRRFPYDGVYETKSYVYASLNWRL